MNRCGPSSHLVLRVQDSNAQEKSQSRGRVGPTGQKPTPPRALGCVHARAGWGLWVRLEGRGLLTITQLKKGFTGGKQMPPI